MEVQMHRESLVIALTLAVAEHEKMSKASGNTIDPKMCAGWKQVLEVVKQGGNITFFETKK